MKKRMSESRNKSKIDFISTMYVLESRQEGLIIYWIEGLSNA